MIEYTSTIAAVSTPPGKGGVALIRLSGAQAFEVADRCFLPRSGKPLSAHPARTAVYGDILSEGERIDDGIAIRFPHPHSYTGEDTVEFTCHGGLQVTRMVLQALLCAGAEPATPGAFTRRAFLNGRLTLSDAEAIGSLLDASTDTAVRLYSSTARTHLNETIEYLHGGLLRLLSTQYAAIDFPDEDVPELTRSEVVSEATELMQVLTRLCDTYRTGCAVTEGIPTVICGRPNVGKSSLYNLLAHDDAAIVTDIAGTTRDILERSVSLGRILLRVSDTAGLRETADTVEQIGVERARARMRESALVLALLDASRPLEEEDRRWLDELTSLPGTVVLLLNKSDLPTQIRAADFADRFRYVFPFSTKQEEPLQVLTHCLEELFTDPALIPGQDAILSSARQYAALSRAKEALARALDAYTQGLPTDIASSDLELALTALAETDGRTVNEEIVSEIFSKFCVGK